MNPENRTFRKAPALWKVHGEIRKAEAKGWYKADRRTVVVVAEDFAEASAVGADALLHNWSANPSVARVLSVNPTTLGGESDWPLLWPEGSGDAK